MKNAKEILKCIALVCLGIGINCYMSAMLQRVQKERISHGQDKIISSQ